MENESLQFSEYGFLTKYRGPLAMLGALRSYIYIEILKIDKLYTN